MVGVLAGWWVGGAPGVVGVGFDFGAEAGGRQGGDTWAVIGKIYTARKLLCDSSIWWSKTMGLITQSGSCVSQNTLGKEGDMMYLWDLKCHLGIFVGP